MPCILRGEESVRIAEYGTSNSGRMKHVYRRGLHYRYGRLMQTISGIHYNFSPPEAFWEAAWQDDGAPGTRQDYITRRYLGLIRNFHRWSWLLIYLFGASPAVCASFLRGRRGHGLEPMDPEGNTLYRPHATSLRMGGLGYNSEAQRGLAVCYNDLGSYLKTLKAAILTPHPAYAQFPCGEGGDYQQLNDSLLQIENEFYSTIRPKRVARSGERPTAALRRGGVEYVEIRSLDVNVFDPSGINQNTMRFVEALLVYCLVEDSPPFDDATFLMANRNHALTARNGRDPAIELEREDGAVSLRRWALEIVDRVAAVAALIDRDGATTDYADSVALMRQRIEDPSATPSAQVLDEIRAAGDSFFEFAMSASRRHRDYFRSIAPLADARLAVLVDEARGAHDRRAVLRRRLTQPACAFRHSLCVRSVRGRHNLTKLRVSRALPLRATPR